MKNYIIIVPQEYATSNHIELWKEMARQTDGRVIIVDISADLVVSLLKHRIYRIKEARSRAEIISKNMFRLRALYPIRPEYTTFPGVALYRKLFWKRLKRDFPAVMQEEVNVLYYTAIWGRILKDSHPNMKLGYYLIDEVRYEADSKDINEKSFKEDEFACRNSDFVLTMTDILADSRKEYNNNIVVIGNGSVIPETYIPCTWKKSKTVAFIGNFRDWVDVELLTNLIKKRDDLFFVFVGPNNPNMSGILNDILNKNLNTAYFGNIAKDRIQMVYQLFSCVIVPYKQNDFMQNTRPIKIVESVCSGTPVVTIPMRGYQESSFIRFATSVDSFSQQIDYVMGHPIEKESIEYKEFLKANSWKKKASVVLNSFSNYKVQ